MEVLSPEGTVLAFPRGQPGRRQAKFDFVFSDNLQLSFLGMSLSKTLSNKCILGRNKKNHKASSYQNWLSACSIVGKMGWAGLQEEQAWRGRLNHPQTKGLLEQDEVWFEIKGLGHPGRAEPVLLRSLVREQGTRGQRAEWKWIRGQLTWPNWTKRYYFLVFLTEAGV